MAMLTSRVSPKELKRQAKIEARREAARNRKQVNDFSARWLALKNDAVQQCATSDNYSACIYAVGLFVLIGLHALARENLAITEKEHVDTLKAMRRALKETSEAEAFTYELRCSLMDGIEIIEAATETVPVFALAHAWGEVDQGLRYQTITSETMNQLIDGLEAEP